MVQPLDTPGCVGRRNCNVNLDNRRWDRPDKIVNSSKRGTSRAIFKWTRQMGRYEGVWARCGGNGWGECGEAIGIFGWGDESGSREPEAAPGFENGDGERQACVAGTVWPCNG